MPQSCKSVPLITLVLLFAKVDGAASICTAFSSAGPTDWLVSRCAATSTFAEVPGGFVLNNSIVSRTFRTTCDETLYTESIRSEASASEKTVAAAPEATMLVASIPVVVGGLGGGGPGVVQLTFGGYRVGVPATRYPFTPGLRGSHITPWPPAGVRVSLDHVAPCSSFVAGAIGVFNVTVSYELYDSVAAFGKSVSAVHNCSSSAGAALSLQVLNMTTDLVALASVRVL
jgi:hypothetical protein